MVKGGRNEESYQRRFDFLPKSLTSARTTHLIQVNEIRDKQKKHLPNGLDKNQYEKNRVWFVIL